MESLFDWIGSRPLLLLLAASSIFTYFWLICCKKQLAIGRIEAAVVSILHVFFGLGAVSLFAYIESPTEYSFGVQSLFGGIFFMPLIYGAWAKITKRDFKIVFDVWTICLVFTLMCARINCLIAGCCQGKLISGLGEIRWPTRELEIVFYIILLLLFVPQIIKETSQGELYPKYMIGYGVFRFVTETARIGDGLFHLSHVWALLSCMVGIAFLLEQKAKTKKGGRVR